MTERTRPIFEDSELVSQAKAGEAEAFGLLYEKYVTVIYRYIRGRVSLESDAEDLTENVFLRSFEALGRYQDRGFPYSAYLYRVARNAIADHHRGKNEEVDLETVGQLGGEWSSVEDDLAKAENIQLLAEAFAKLSDEYREVIYLRVLLAHPTSTVAQWLERSEGAVRVSLHRGLNKLRQLVEEADDS